MEYPTRPTQPRRRNPLKYTFDGHLSPTTPPDDDTPETTDSNHSNSESGESSEYRFSDPNQAAGLAASIQVIANSMLRKEMAELEMLKKREMARLEALTMRAEAEDEMIRMMLQTQSQIASFVSHNSSGKKRKSSSMDDDSSDSRTYKDGASVLGLLHYNTA